MFEASGEGARRVGAQLWAGDEASSAGDEQNVPFRIAMLFIDEAPI